MCLQSHKIRWECFHICTWSHFYLNFELSVAVSIDPKPCVPLLEAPENGKRSLIRLNGFVKYISFSCNLDYVLKGQSLVACINELWSSSTPT